MSMADQNPKQGPSGIFLRPRSPQRFRFSESESSLDQTIMDESCSSMNENRDQEKLSSSFNTGMHDLTMDARMESMERENSSNDNVSSNNLERFKVRIMELRPTELKSAQAFVDRGITEQFFGKYLCSIANTVVSNCEHYLKASEQGMSLQFLNEQELQDIYEDIALDDDNDSIIKEMNVPM